MVLDKESFWKEAELATERVPVGSGEMIVSEIGGEDYLAVWTDPSLRGDDGVDMAKLRPALLVRCVVNELGERIFSDEDAERIRRTKPNLYNELASAAMRLNGLSGDGVKNSEPSPSDSSSSDSP